MCDNGAVAGFAHDKVIMQLDPLLDSIKADKSNIIPAALKWVTYQGGLYGLPFGQDTWAPLLRHRRVHGSRPRPGQAADDPGRAVGPTPRSSRRSNADGSLARAGFIPDDPGPEPRVDLEPLQLPDL